MLLEDCSLYNKQKIHCEHLNMTFTMIFISYSYIIRLVRYLGDEIMNWSQNVVDKLPFQSLLMFC